VRCLSLSLPPPPIPIPHPAPRTWPLLLIGTRMLRLHVDCDA
jgi:hypothetical protein